MLLDHLTSEQPIAVTARGQAVDEWKLFPGRENHLFDCCMMATVAAGSSPGTAKARADAEVGIGSSDFLERLGRSLDPAVMNCHCETLGRVQAMKDLDNRSISSEAVVPMSSLASKFDRARSMGSRDVAHRA